MYGIIVTSILVSVCDVYLLLLLLKLSCAQAHPTTASYAMHDTYNYNCDQINVTCPLSFEIVYLYLMIML